MKLVQPNLLYHLTTVQIGHSISYFCKQ